MSVQYFTRTHPKCYYFTADHPDTSLLHTTMCYSDFSRQMRMRVQYLTKMHSMRYYFRANPPNSGLFYTNVQFGFQQTNANEAPIFDQNSPSAKRYFFTASHLNSGLLHINVQLGLPQINANVDLIFGQNAPNTLLFHGKSPKLWTASHKCAIGITIDKCD